MRTAGLLALASLGMTYGATYDIPFYLTRSGGDIRYFKSYPGKPGCDTKHCTDAPTSWGQAVVYAHPRGRSYFWYDPQRAAATDGGMCAGCIGDTCTAHFPLTDDWYPRDSWKNSDIYTTSGRFLAVDRTVDIAYMWGTNHMKRETVPGNVDWSTVAVHTNDKYFVAIDAAKNTAVFWGGDTKSSGATNQDGPSSFTEWNGATVTAATDETFLFVNAAKTKACCWSGTRTATNCRHPTSRIRRDFPSDWQGMQLIFSNRMIAVALNTSSGKAYCWGPHVRYPKLKDDKNEYIDCAAEDISWPDMTLYANEKMFVVVETAKNKVKKCWGQYCGDIPPIFRRWSTSDVYAAQGDFLIVPKSGEPHLVSCFGSCNGFKKEGRADRDKEKWSDWSKVTVRAGLFFLTYDSSSPLSEQYFCFGGSGSMCHQSTLLSNFRWTGSPRVFSNGNSFLAIQDSSLPYAKTKAELNAEAKADEEDDKTTQLVIILVVGWTVFLLMSGGGFAICYCMKQATKKVQAAMVQWHNSQQRVHEEGEAYKGSEFAAPPPQLESAAPKGEGPDKNAKPKTLDGMIGELQAVQLDASDLEVLRFDKKRDRHMFVPPAQHPKAYEAKMKLKEIRDEVYRVKTMSPAARTQLLDFLKGKVRPFLLKYTEMAKDEQVQEVMKYTEEKLSGNFSQIYLGVLARTKDDNPHYFEGMTEQLVKELEAVKKRQDGKTMAHTKKEITDVLPSGIPAHGRLKTWCRKLADTIKTEEGEKGCVVVEAHGKEIAMKEYWRGMEKITFEPEEKKRDIAQFVFDFAREGMYLLDYKCLGDTIAKICASADITVVRIKDRISTNDKATSCGWADVMVNFYFKDDEDKHICEVQLFHEEMLKARSQFGGHADYEIYRTIFEIFAYIGGSGGAANRV